APAVQRDPDQSKILRFELRQAVALRDGIDRLRRRAWRERGDDFVGHQGLLGLGLDCAAAPAASPSTAAGAAITGIAVAGARRRTTLRGTAIGGGSAA